ncbi:HAD family hydrolase [Shewanella intestini]|uniref:HAD-IA family hydrolase n=1 Tax=Shewanella intestini TaxID=2017544 RepID=A0ABS5I157_9GAMM|nr:MULTISPECIES: HAD-IA family hydrolase [Shewanella]MBR9727759.1 HAD-IA family hydrolase [Shewanella intestini]MRG36248.1 HAD-IA family hydrolase [Shewanella sp. XMDDZSB0408]
MKQYKLVIFDWDGTLMDTIGKIVDCMQSVALELKLPIPSELQVRDIIGLSILPAMEQLFPDFEDNYDTLLAAYKNHYLHLNLTPTPLFDGVESLLNQLQQSGKILAVATGKRREGLDRLLNETGFSKYFSATRSADEAASKPHPSMITSLLAQLNIAPEQAIMIGDSKLDIAMANNAGVDSIGVTYGAHSLQDLLTQHPTVTVDSPAEMLMHL